MDIITKSKISPYLQYQRLFDSEDITLEANEKACKSIAEKCHQQDIGARGIKTMFDKMLRDTLYNIRSLKKKGLLGVKITESTVDKNDQPKYNFDNE
jgi:ATP-dependent Clp protease ATP-binding subunit ClpX